MSLRWNSPVNKREREREREKQFACFHVYYFISPSGISIFIFHTTLDLQSQTRNDISYNEKKIRIFLLKEDSFYVSKLYSTCTLQEGYSTMK